MTGKRGPSLTVARVDALLVLVAKGEVVARAEVSFAERTLRNAPDNAEAKAKREDLLRCLELAKEARQILASRRKVKRTWRT